MLLFLLEALQIFQLMVSKVVIVRLEEDNFTFIDVVSMCCECR
jgi:hypothetical protein